MANATHTISHSSTVYKAVPERSTSAISSRLGRLFGTPTSGTLSRESSASSLSGQRHEWEVSASGQRYKTRGLEAVQQELDDYLEEQLETFSRTEEVGGVEQTVVFDILAYWQVRDFSPPCTKDLMLAQTVEKRFPNLFCLAMDVLPAQASSVPCEHLFSSGKETCTARRNRIQPKLMEALQALKLSSRNGSLNLTEHLSAGYYSDDVDVCEAQYLVSYSHLFSIYQPFVADDFSWCGSSPRGASVLFFEFEINTKMRWILHLP
jgi:hypothetical protein